MTAEHISESSVVATLEQLEQRHPQLANLLSLRANESPKKRITRSEEIENILTNQSSQPLSEKEKRAMGRWLQSHYDRIQENPFDNSGGVSEADLLLRYSSAKWTNSSKMLWSDMKMLKEVAAHFNEIAVGGQSASVIEADDVADLARGATVKRTEYDVTSTYPEGGLHRITSEGIDYRLKADGSMIVRSPSMDMDLNADGTGIVKSRFQYGGSSGGLPGGLADTTTEIPLKRGTDDVWRGKTPDGEDFELAIDSHSVSLKNGDIEMLLTSKGGYIKDTELATNMTIHPDSSLTMDSADEGSANIGQSPDGTVIVVSDNGTREIVYPFGVMAKRLADGKVFIEGGGPFRVPTIHQESDGSFEVQLADEKKLQSVKQDDGTSTATLPDGRSVKTNADKSIVYTITAPGGSLEVKFGMDDKATIYAGGEELGSFAPLPLKTPKRLYF